MSRHELCYEILNAHNLGDDCTRIIDVHATPDELAQLDREGYLVREGLFTGSALATLRDAVERLAPAAPISLFLFYHEYNSQFPYYYHY